MLTGAQLGSNGSQSNTARLSPDIEIVTKAREIAEITAVKWMSLQTAGCRENADAVYTDVA